MATEEKTAETIFKTMTNHGVPGWLFVCDGIWLRYADIKVVKLDHTTHLCDPDTVNVFAGGYLVAASLQEGVALTLMRMIVRWTQ